MNNVTSPVIQTLSELQSIAQNLLLLLSEKEKQVIVKRFNLDGKGKYTLEEIGKEFSVTRERIRQIEKSALGKMKRNVFNTSLNFLHQYVGAMVKDNGGLMREDALFKHLEKLMNQVATFERNCAHLSLVLHENLDCIGNTINFYPYVKERSLNDEELREISDKIIKNLNAHGDVKKMDAILKEVAPTNETLTSARAKSLVSVDKRLTILDEDLIGLMEWRHIHPRTLRDKILFILRNAKTPMHFTEISKAITEKSFDNRQVNVQAVHNELIRHDQFILIGRGIYALSDWGYEKGTVADVVEGILREHGELDQDKIIELVLSKRQVKKITIVLSLKNDQKFERVGRKRYRLIKKA